MKTPTTLTDADIDRLYVAPTRYRGRMTKKIGLPANHADRMLELQYVTHLNETAQEAALEPIRMLADAYISLCAELARIPRVDERPAYHVLWNDNYTDGILKRLSDASRTAAGDRTAILGHTRPLPDTVQTALSVLVGQFGEAAAVWCTADGRLFLHSDETVDDYHRDIWTGPHTAEEIVTALQAVEARLEAQHAKEEAESAALEKDAKAIAKAAGIKGVRLSPGVDAMELTEAEAWSQRLVYTMTDAQALVDDGRATDLTHALRLMGIEDVYVSPVS